MNNSIRFVPFSVKMRSRGFVRNPINSWSLSVPKWIPAPPSSPVVDMTKVDRVVDVLSRFVATWVAQSRAARREYRIREAGRMLPDGLEFVDRCVEPNFARCFQLMRCDDARKLQEWILQWRGYGISFEIIPVVPSAETRAVVEAKAEPDSA